MKVEPAFGRLKQRFRQLYHCKLSVIRCVPFVHACCVLHNLADEDDLRFLEPGQEEERVPNPIMNVFQEMEFLQNDNRGVAMRDELCRQFIAGN